MWTFFVLASVFVLVLLYIPGYMMSRVVFASAARALAFSPVVTVALLVAFGITLSPLSVPWFALPLLAVFVSAAAFLLFRKPLVKTGSRTWFSIGLYAVVGVGLTTFVFLGGIDGAASFSILTDTTFHLQCAQAMLQSGHYSVLSASVYPELIVRGEGGFYPAAWHILTAIAAGATAMPITVAHNAVNFVICAFVFPLSAWVLLAFLFRDKEETIIAGAFVCCSFASFPWNFLIAGQYDANLLAFSLMPLPLYLLANIFASGERELPFAGSVILLALSMFSLAASQTNALFAVGVLSIPLIVLYSWKTVQGISGSVPKAVIASVTVMLAIGAIWYGAYSLPFMQDVVQVKREVFAGGLQEMANILTLSFGPTFAPQPVLGCLVIVGALLIMRKERSCLWVVAAYLISCLLCYVCAVVDNPIRQVLCGFWYTGINRIGGIAVLAAIPIAAVALGEAMALLRGFFHSFALTKAACVACAFLLLAGVASNVVLEKMGFSSGLRYVSERIESDYKYANPVSFSQEEREFIEKIKPYVADDLVVNIPSDGSIWLYGTDGTNTMCRWFYSSPSKEYDLFKSSLDEAGYNEEVKLAVKSSGAKYLLYLDETIHIGSFDESEWEGILSVTDETPGFETVLADGNMRLYRITE